MIKGCLLYILLIICVTFCQCLKTKIIPESIGPKTETVQEENYTKILFVSTDGSDQGGNGSKERPWRTIPFALSQIRNAGVTNQYAVCVDKGTYAETTIVMKSFVDLYGGFDRSDWQRDINEYRTVLSGNGKRRVFIGANDTRLDGFVITRGVVGGKGGAFSVVVCCPSSRITSSLGIKHLPRFFGSRNSAMR